MRKFEILRNGRRMAVVTFPEGEDPAQCIADITEDGFFTVKEVPVNNG